MVAVGFGYLLNNVTRKTNFANSEGENYGKKIRFEKIGKGDEHPDEPDVGKKVHERAKELGEKQKGSPARPEHSKEPKPPKGRRYE